MNTAALIDALEDSQYQLEAAIDKQTKASEKRNKLIKQALAAGVKQADIARLTGLSRARIAQLR